MTSETAEAPETAVAPVAPEAPAAPVVPEAPVAAVIPEAPVAAEAAGPPKAAGPPEEAEEPALDPQKIAGGWLWAALGSVALATWASVVVALGTHPTIAHRAAAAGTALLVVVALAFVAQAILLWYQGATGHAPGRDVPEG
jgi:hypothetical protein